MTKNEVLNSILLKKRFCKDCNLPISVFENPYFYERLCTIDKMFKCVNSFNEFCKCLERFENEQSYFEYYNSVKDSIIESIKNNLDFQRFNSESFAIRCDYEKRNVYIDENDSKAFISIDMKKANFSALNYYSNKIFDGCNFWEDYISKFTDDKHIINSKYIRQVIFGACNPKKQIAYEHYIMVNLVTYIKSKIPDISNTIFSVGEDEIIIEVRKNTGYSFKELCEVVKSCPNGVGDFVRVDMYELSRISGTDGWMKSFYNYTPDGTEKIEFKCLNSEMFHQIVKHYYNEKITENDLVFYHNGSIAKFLYEVNNPWN